MKVEERQKDVCRLSKSNSSVNEVQTDVTSNINDTQKEDYVEENIDLSVVCMNNNEDVLNRFLLPSVRKQVNARYEIKIIDNCNNQYAGVREAFNEVVRNLHGKYIVFVHNDFRFTESDAFQKIIKYCESLEPFGVIGVAGCGFETYKLVQTRIIHGLDNRNVGKKINKPVSVMSVDECCFIVKRSQVLQIPFEKKDGWHLYAVEYCLQMLDYGKHNYVIPIEGWHLSDGVSLNAAYCIEMKKLLKKYSNKYSYINTTVKHWKTGVFSREIYLRYYAFKQKIKSKIIKK